MKIILTLMLSILFFAIHSSTFAEDKVLRFSISTYYPPFQYLTKEGTPCGIHYDVLRHVVEQQGYQVKMVLIPRNRIEERVLAGTEDIFPSAIDWVGTPEKFVYTEPITNILESIFSLTTNEVNIKKIDDMVGKTVVTIRGYSYPKLDSYFKDGRIKRQDVKDELTALNMVALKRAEFAVLGETAGRWLIKNNELGVEFKTSDLKITSTSFRFIFNKKWKKIIPIINEEVSVMRKEGRLQKIIDKYVKKEKKDDVKKKASKDDLDQKDSENKE